MEASIEDTIQQVERLYETTTGKRAPAAEDGSYAPIPPEADAAQYIEERLGQLAQLLGADSQKRPAITWSPAMSLREEPEALVLEVDLPGVERDSVQVELERNVLTVTGVRLAPPDWQCEGGRVIQSERAFGAFQRAVVLPMMPSASELGAHLRDGVLVVRVPQKNGTAGKASIPIS